MGKIGQFRARELEKKEWTITFVADIKVTSSVMGKKLVSQLPEDLEKFRPSIASTHAFLNKFEALIVAARSRAKTAPVRAYSVVVSMSLQASSQADSTESS